MHLEEAEITSQRRHAEYEVLLRERDELQQQLRATGDRESAAAEQAAAAARRVQQLENALVLAESHLQKVKYKWKAALKRDYGGFVDGTPEAGRYYQCKVS